MLVQNGLQRHFPGRTVGVVSDRYIKFQTCIPIVLVQVCLNTQIREMNVRNSEQGNLTGDTSQLMSGILGKASQHIGQRFTPHLKRQDIRSILQGIRNVYFIRCHSSQMGTYLTVVDKHLIFTMNSVKTKDDLLVFPVLRNFKVFLITGKCG